MTTRRSRSEERLVEVYDSEVLPLWTQRFARMLFRGLEVPPRGVILDAACHSGYTTLELLRRLEAGQGRIVALDASPVLLDVARQKVGVQAGKRVYFRTERSHKLSFADDVYDLVVSNLGLSDVDQPEPVVREWVRVTKPGGTLAITCAARGTWQEFIDIYREVLIKLERPAVLGRLEAYVASIPTTEELLGWLESSGMGDVQIEVEEFELLFKSGREFFFAPVIEYGPLPRWKNLAGKPDEMQDLFWQMKEAIDTYFDGRHPFSVRVVAASVRGKKPPRAP
jgi:ubiquinone/menaquinone biosynthesis C-methylase UbiE